jgi:L-ascorbate metabolism protein UlaG (beta-lactamase superfamily)
MFDHTHMRLAGSVMIGVLVGCAAAILLIASASTAGAARAETPTPTGPGPNPAPAITIDDQVILPGERFRDIVLADAVDDAGYADESITWTVSGNVDLEAQIADGVASVTPPDDAWRGSETLRFEACNPAGACSAADAIFWAMEDSDVDVTVTYVGNSGFLITAGDQKILIDALFQGFEGGYALPSEELDLLLNARPPFDGVDLILASHDHADHFSASMVNEFMANDPDAVFVSVESAASQISAAGHPAISLNLYRGERAQRVINGIGLEAIYLSHGDDTVPNLGLIVTVGGRRFFHTGDMDPATVTLDDLQGYGLPEKHIDIAFVPHFALIYRATLPLVREGIQPRFVVPIHYAYTTPPLSRAAILNYFPDAVLFHSEMESWTMPE